MESDEFAINPDEQKHQLKERCDMCNEVIAKQQWLLLNRYGVGTGAARCLTQVGNSREYLWELGDDEDGETDYTTGTLLCWPDCVIQWIEGKMMATNFEVRK